MHEPFAVRVGRRGLLTGALVAGVAIATGVAEAKTKPTAPRRAVLPRKPELRTAPTGEVPEVLAVAGAEASAPGFPIGYVGVSWSGRSRGGRIRFRTERGWGRWHPLRPDDSASPDRPATLIPAGGAESFELAAPAGADDVQLLAINTTDGPSSGLTFATPTRRYGSRYRNRAGWGADESWRFGSGGEELWPPEYFPTQTLTVHHTVTDNNDPDPAATVRAIYRWQAVEQGWGDIGYHLLIDQAGVVYEGRHSGPDAISVFGPNTTEPPLMCTAGHVGGFNSGNIGVALLGDLTSVQPTAAARRALVRVLASLAHTTGLDPLGTVDYVNPVNGATHTVDTISGHRDWLATQCPGNTFYPTLPSLRQEVSDLIESGDVIRLR